MAQAGSKKKGKGSTPGRPRKTTNQFFEPGKVGRKTGITLVDNGVRDEHGLEPVSGIFSSPVSPRRDNLDSSDGNMHESSGPDLDMTLASRKTPRLPPARASTPKHTNIGSPKRASTGRHTVQRVSGSGTTPVRSQLRPNRLLDFGEGGVRTSIESASPFKPRHALRRSTGAGATNPFAASPAAEPTSAAVAPEEHEADAGAELDSMDDGPILLDDGNFQDALPEEEEIEVEEEQRPAEVLADRRKSGRPRRSGGSADSSLIQQTAPVAPMLSARKRDHSTLEQSHVEDVNQSIFGQPERAQKKPRSSRSSTSQINIPEDEDDAASDAGPLLDDHEDTADEYVQDEEPVEEEQDVEGSAPPEPVQSKTKGRGRTKSKTFRAPKERDPNRAMRGQSSQVQLSDSPSKLRAQRREGSRGLSVGPISNVHHRASTPFEDAAQRTSRYGRNLINPLKYWANEMRIYKEGETAGIVRADPVPSPKRKRKTTKKSRGRRGKMEDLDEESEAESVRPDEWEEELGVIAGEVANWNPETEQGDPNDLVREDLGFAAPSIAAKDVNGATFRYAKIMTLPFFGSGLVELPPQGEKRAKNCRKMQMCFFVHVGKVVVEVYAAGDMEATTFAISKGGAWVVPRGNNYSILNESSTTTARIFFAQGCEVAEMGK